MSVVFLSTTSGCARSPRQLRTMLPTDIETGWKLTRVDDMHPAELKQELAGMPWQQAIRAQYTRGANTISVDLVEMRTEEDASTIARGWNRADTSVLRRGEMLVVLHGAQVPKEELTKFAGTLHRAM